MKMIIEEKRKQLREFCCGQDCDDCILKNDYIRLDITKDSFVDVLDIVTKKLGRKPKVVEMANAYKNDRVTPQIIRFYMKKYGLEDKFDYRPHKK